MTRRSAAGFLVKATGHSAISIEDLAVALVAEAERPVWRASWVVERGSSAPAEHSVAVTSLVERVS